MPWEIKKRFLKSPFEKFYYFHARIEKAIAKRKDIVK